MTTIDLTPALVQAIAAVLTLGTAVVALLIAVKGPERSAQFAEHFRKLSKAEEDRRQIQMFVFTALMKCRSQILHADAITALNLIEVAFADSQPIRDARRHFMEATLEEPSHAIRIVERYQTLIGAIARELGLSDTITFSDIQAGYYPTGLGKMDEAALADAEEKIARQQARASGNSPATVTK